MAAFTHAAEPPTPSRIHAATRTCIAAITAAAQRLATPHKAAVTNLLHMPLTASGTGCIDYAAFHLGTGWGWLTTGSSLIILELIIADEQ